MQIPDQMLKCVVFLGYKNQDDIPCLAGTAFFVSRRIEGTEGAFTYLVTAKHVIDKIRDRGSDQVCVRINRRSGDAIWLETDIQNWFYHPDDNEVDVAALWMTTGIEYDHRTLPLGWFIPDRVLERDVGVGREVFLTGLFAPHHGQRKNIPIVRVGNIAAMPIEKVQASFGLIDAYLVEARSLGGLSGSPVFVGIPGFSMNRQPTGLLAVSPSHSYYLLGLAHGHWDARDDARTDANAAEDAQGRSGVNMGIAIVIPSSKILEVINQPEIRKVERQEEAQYRKSLLPVADILPDA